MRPGHAAACWAMRVGTDQLGNAISSVVAVCDSSACAGASQRVERVASIVGVARCRGEECAEDPSDAVDRVGIEQCRRVLEIGAQPIAVVLHVDAEIELCPVGRHIDLGGQEFANTTLACVGIAHLEQNLKRGAWPRVRGASLSSSICSKGSRWCS